MRYEITDNPFPALLPRAAAFKSQLRTSLKKHRDQYLEEAIRPSHTRANPERDKFKTKIISSQGKNINISTYHNEEFHATLFRIRTGHTYTQQHLFSHEITESPTCPHCNENTDTPEHLLIYCEGIQSDELNSAREEYELRTRGRQRFNRLIWTNPRIIIQLIKAATLQGARI